MPSAARRADLASPDSSVLTIGGASGMISDAGSMKSCGGAGFLPRANGDSESDE